MLARSEVADPRAPDRRPAPALHARVGTPIADVAIARDELEREIVPEPVDQGRDAPDRAAVPLAREIAIDEDQDAGDRVILPREPSAELDVF